MLAGLCSAGAARARAWWHAPSEPATDPEIAAKLGQLQRPPEAVWAGGQKVKSGQAGVRRVCGSIVAKGDGPTLRGARSRVVHWWAPVEGGSRGAEAASLAWTWGGPNLVCGGETKARAEEEAKRRRARRRKFAEGEIYLGRFSPPSLAGVLLFQELGLLVTSGQPKGLGADRWAAHGALANQPLVDCSELARAGGSLLAQLQATRIESAWAERRRACQECERACQQRRDF